MRRCRRGGSIELCMFMYIYACALRGKLVTQRAGGAAPAPVGLVWSARPSVHIYLFQHFDAPGLQSSSCDWQ